MDFQAQLVHADGQRRVVLVQAFEAERCVGSALGEASSAEEAEDRAMDRLRQRLPSQRSPSAAPSLPQPPPSLGPPPLTRPSVAPPLASPSDASPPLAAGPNEVEPPEAVLDPEDWGTDLSEVDRLVRSLGWGREEERIYMERLFGHPSRSRLTRYADLMLLRRALEALPPGSEPGSAPVPLQRSELLSQCDGLLGRLGWATERARQCLEQHFAVTSRQHLRDEQLLAFNLLLEGELLEPSQVD
jgi:hypothetical protein